MLIIYIKCLFERERQREREICYIYLLFGYPTSKFGLFLNGEGDSLTQPMLITAFVKLRPEGYQERCNKVRSLSPAERLVEFEPSTLWFLLKCFNPLGHFSPIPNFIGKCKSHLLFSTLSAKLYVFWISVNKTKSYSLACSK